MCSWWAGLEFFRADHRDEQINKQREGDQADDDGFHKWSEFFTPVGVKFRRAEEQRDHSEVNQVIHDATMTHRWRGG
ncbi:MAG: hypothetical protein NTZ16_02275 [Verrucomicrobia bacterium]|nr:hypothetical protein [Verrucomicrobiota bacterium]